jgi:esterase/lipase
MRKAAQITLVLLATVVAVYLLGPRASRAELDASPVELRTPLHALDAMLRERESRHVSLKPDNEASITWANDTVARTEFAVVFLHGFSASKVEGRPVTTAFARTFGMNLFEPRLFGHGLDTVDALIGLTPENYLHSAKEAIAIGKVIGKKVIVMGSSTGGTLGLYLAAHDPDIAAVMCYSPNIAIFDPNAKRITGPWGLQLARLLSGGNSRGYEASEEIQRYWQTSYRLESIVTVQSVLDATMHSGTFQRIMQPVFVGCYYKNETEQDRTVSVQAMREMMPQLGTAPDRKRFVEFSDATGHVITNDMRGGNVDAVLRASVNFAEEVLGLRPVVTEAEE